MNRYAFLAAAIAATVAGVAVAAPQDTTVRTAAERGERGHHMLKLDVNQDGAIDRAEAAKLPRLAAHFDRMDRNGDGRIEASERPRWKKGHHRGGHRGHHGGGMMGHVLRLDANDDGRISKVETAASKRFAERFDSIDGNRDGYLVRSELIASAERMRAERDTKRRERFEQKFADADGNNDGRLSRAEIESAMPRMAKRFAFMDEDRDGFLTREDLQPTHRR